MSAIGNENIFQSPTVSPGIFLKTPCPCCNPRSRMPMPCSSGSGMGEAECPLRCGARYRGRMFCKMPNKAVGTRRPEVRFPVESFHGSQPRARLTSNQGSLVVFVVFPWRIKISGGALRHSASASTIIFDYISDPSHDNSSSANICFRRARWKRKRTPFCYSLTDWRRGASIAVRSWLL